MKKPSQYHLMTKGMVPVNSQQQLVICCANYLMTVQDMVNFIEFNRIDSTEELISAVKAKLNKDMSKVDAFVICRYAPVTAVF